METNNKLREALTKILNLTNSLDEDCGVDPVEIRDIARAALAEPVRNYEVGTAEEQAERWYWRYHVGHLCQSCPLGPRKWSEVDAGTLCFSEWQQMPYEEGDAK